MNQNCTSCMNQNMPSGARNMRGGYAGGPQMARQPQNRGGNMPGNAQNNMPGAAQNGCGCNTPNAAQNNMPGAMQNGCGCNTSNAAQNNMSGAMQNDCGCNTPGSAQGRASLLLYLDEVSFAAYDAALYLDTHPDCSQGMQYFCEQNEKRRQALKEYGRLYGPLTLTQACRSGEEYWQWMNQPWPWEGGNC